MKVNQGRLGFKVEMDQRPAGLTSYAGIPLFVETARALGLPALVERFLGQKWGHRRGYSAADLILIILVGIVAGAKNVADISAMGQDKGLQVLLGLKRWPSESVIKRFLYWFHELPKWTAGERGRAVIPVESASLGALGKVNREIVQALQERRSFDKITIDLDATIIESAKVEALPHYDGGRGFQPWIAYSPEMGIVLRDQFRDGNVPASMGALNQIKRSVLAVPTGVKKIAVRGDTAMYCPKALTWMDGKGIDFGISMPMVSDLRARIEALPASSWSRHRKLNPFGGVIPTDLEIAEVEFVSNAMATSKKGQPFRILVVRRVDEQGALFGASGKVRDENGRRWYLALITNKWDEPAEQVWSWSRERCGSVEMAHAELKNDLAAGVMPCGRFQSNAAWFRFNVLAYNILSSLQLLALPKPMQAWRPATLRFRLLNLAGRIVHHSRELVLRLPWIADLVDVYREARERLWNPRHHHRPAPAT